VRLLLLVIVNISAAIRSFPHYGGFRRLRAMANDTPAQRQGVTGAVGAWVPRPVLHTFNPVGPAARRRRKPGAGPPVGRTDGAMGRPARGVRCRRAGRPSRPGDRSASASPSNVNACPSGLPGVTPMRDADTRRRHFRTPLQAFRGCCRCCAPVSSGGHTASFPSGLARRTRTWPTTRSFPISVTLSEKPIREMPA